MPTDPRAAAPPPPPSLPSADLLGDVNVLGYEGVTFQGGEMWGEGMERKGRGGGDSHSLALLPSPLV